MKEGPRYFELGRVIAEDPEFCFQGGIIPSIFNGRVDKRFKVVQKLGYGGYAAIRLAPEDDKGRYVVLEIVVATIPRR
ncbi:putative CMGC SRPK protein kinase [Rosellinia necatrix]|uniref:Putative CMGC SRPK protein kinase n=1 Tax=Rosellinia necatrix TaxID=77044 RepID=A0A1S8A8S3_ROSNE|nr:putative CMGC SRPK protein kinase [Rosellinia necatrix]